LVSFVFAEVFTFTGDAISWLETFHIDLDRDTLFTAAPTGGRLITASIHST